MKAGPMLKRYADYFGIPIAEVVAWANDVIERPVPAIAAAYPTKEAREASLKEYIKAEVDGSLTSRVKRAIEAKRAGEAQVPA